MDDTDPIDYTKEKCVSFSYLASIALLRGKTQSLKVLRDGIRGLEELKEIRCLVGITPLALFMSSTFS